MNIKHYKYYGDIHKYMYYKGTQRKRYRVNTSIGRPKSRRRMRVGNSDQKGINV